MNAELLLEHFHRLGDAPDAVPRLRRFILDLAVRGKLVLQNPKDEPAVAQLKRIVNARQRMVRAGEIKAPREVVSENGHEAPIAIPQGWTMASLNQVSPLPLTDGDWIETKDQAENGRIRLVQLADVGDGDFRNKSHRFITEETEVRLNCTRLIAGDVLIARLPSPIGRACVFPDIGRPAITSVDVAILRADDNISREYVAIAVNSPSTREQIEAYGKGTTRFRVSTGHLKTVRIPVPPLAEQHRIVAKVDELMALCDQLEAVLKLRDALRSRLLESVLNADEDTKGYGQPKGDLSMAAEP